MKPSPTPLSGTVSVKILITDLSLLTLFNLTTLSQLSTSFPWTPASSPPGFAPKCWATWSHGQPHFSLSRVRPCEADSNPTILGPPYRGRRSAGHADLRSESGSERLSSVVCRLRQRLRLARWHGARIHARVLQGLNLRRQGADVLSGGAWAWRSTSPGFVHRILDLDLPIVVVGVSASRSRQHPGPSLQCLPTRATLAPGHDGGRPGSMQPQDFSCS